MSTSRPERPASLRFASCAAFAAYNVLLHLALPWVWGRLYWKARRAPGYGERIGERFGAPPATLPTGAIWFHAVSAGEAIAAAPVIRALRGRLPAAPLLVTTMTPTGSDRVRHLLGDIAGHCYAPYDYPWAVSSFLRRARPTALVLVETELWPNLVRQTADSGAPVYLVNARLSERSWRGYRRLAPLLRPTLDRIAGVACQYEATARRFQDLGARGVEVTGSVKWDAELPAACLDAAVAPGEAPTWIAGSTHPGEDDVVLEAHRNLRRRVPGLRLIVVPRHPERCGDIERGCAALGLAASRLSAPSTAWEVLIGDTVGSLAALYGLADVAFIGGSLNNTGGHNPIEAAVHGVPMAMGPARFNFDEVCAAFAARGCLHAVGGAQQLADVVGALLGDAQERSRQGEAARAVVAENRGARQRLVERLCAWLTPVLRSRPTAARSA